MNNPELNKRIEEYVDERLSAEDREKFEKQLRQDEDLYHRVKEYKKTILLAKAGLLSQDLRSYLKKRRDYRRFQYGLGALLVFLLATIAYFYFFSPPWEKHKEQNASLFAENYVAPPTPPIVMGSDSQSSIMKGVQHYRTGHYSEALSAWSELSNAHKVSDTLQYYRSICYIETEKYDQAIAGLSAIPSSSAYHDESLWFRSLVLARQSDYDEAQSALQQYLIQYPYGDYARQAQQVLTIMESRLSK